ncbi:MAG: UDP-N-acetylmuramate dehydrogenase [Fibrobacter sp.]|nr:UDP-N-acetylmuramate dehydrogenase [Fibrobacter sp.]
MVILENELMRAHTSFKVGGPARFFVKAEHMDDLKNALALAREKGLPHFVLGNGTNLLVSDKGYDGVIISLAGDFSEIADLGNGKFKVGAATPLGRFARHTLKQGYAGIHKLAGIPGTLGGAVYMNAGAYGQEVGNCCTGVTVLDAGGNIRELPAAECCFGYRQSIFNYCKEIPGQAGDDNGKIILAATFQLQSASSQELTVADLEAELAECMAKRKATQPLNMPNAGSTFKRLEVGAATMPTQIAPGYYIEQTGLKGYRIGGAEVSTLHANFIVNAGNATAQDIKNLSEYVQSKVAEKFGIQLQREIILLGNFEG